MINAQMSTCQSFQSKKMLATTLPNKQMLGASTVIFTNINAFIQVIDHIRNQTYDLKRIFYVILLLNSLICEGKDC